MMDISIRAVTPDEQWDALLRTDRGLFFSSSRYLAHLSHLLPGAVPSHLAAFRGDEMTALMPNIIAEHPRHGKISNSLPYYGSHGGVYTSESGERRSFVIRALLREYMEQNRKARCALSTVVEPLGNTDSAVYEQCLSPWRRDGRVGQVLENLSSDEEAMLGRYEKTRRYDVRRAERLGITAVPTADLTAFEYLYSTHVENISALGGRPKERRFFDLIPSIYRAEEDWLMYEARYEGKTIASLLMFYFGESAEYYCPVYTDEFRSLQPLTFLVHRAIMDAARRGFTRFNFGGTWESQQGVYAYKSRWGSSDIRYRYYITLLQEDSPLLAEPIDSFLQAFPGFYLYPKSGTVEEAESSTLAQ